MDECKPLDRGGEPASGDQPARERGGGDHGTRVGHTGRGGAAVRRCSWTQLDPIKAILKAPGTKRLKLKYDELLLNIAFKFNLRRYSAVGAAAALQAGARQCRGVGAQRDRCGRAWQMLLATSSTRILNSCVSSA